MAAEQVSFRSLINMLRSEKATYWDKPAPGVKRKRADDAYSFPTARMTAVRKSKVKILRPVRHQRLSYAPIVTKEDVALLAKYCDENHYSCDCSSHQDIPMLNEEIPAIDHGFGTSSSVPSMPRSPQDILPWVLHEISFPTDPKEDKDPHKVQLSIDVRPNGIILEFVQRLFEDPRLVKPTSVSAVPQEDENTTAHDSGIGTGSGLPSMLDIQEEQARPTVSNFRHYKENQDPNNVESSKPVRSKKTKRESAQPSAKEEQKLSSQF